MELFIRSLPYNFYAVLSIGLVGLIAVEAVPDFGPMRTAEKRAREAVNRRVSEGVCWRPSVRDTALLVA